MINPFTPLQKLGMVALALALLGGAWYFFETKGSTQVAITLTNPGGPTVDLNRGLVGHWTFDGADIDWGSTTAEIKDRSGNGNHGDAQFGMAATTSPTVGVIGQALQFDGLDDVVYAGGGDGYRGPVTYGAWIRPASSTGAIVWRGGVQGLNPFNGFELIGVNSVRFAQHTNNQLVSVVTSDNTIELNAWQHVAVTSDGIPGSGDVHVYINGKEASYASVIAGDGTLSVTGNGLRIGSKYNPLPESFYQGSIDDVREYRRALSAEEVKRLYELGATTRISETLINSGGPTVDLNRDLILHYTFDGDEIDRASTTREIVDRSGRGNHADWVAFGATTTLPGVLGQAVETVDSGGLDVLDFGNFGMSGFDFDGGTGSFSVAMWLNPYDFFDHDLVNPSTQTIPFQINSCVGGGNIAFAFSSTTASSQNLFTQLRSSVGSTTTMTIPSVEARQWTHLAYVFNRATGSVIGYKNGVSVASAAIASPPGGDVFDCSASSGAYFGAGPNPGDFNFHGAFDDVRVYGRALSGEEVKRLYELGATTRISETLTNPGGPTVDLNRGLVGHWTFDGPDVDWSSTTAEIRDRSPSANHGNATSTMTATSSPQPGAIGQALLFNGANSLVVASSKPNIDGLTTLTASAWVYVNTYGEGGFGRILQKGYTNSNNVGWQFYVSSGKKTRFIYYWNGAPVSWAAANNSIRTGTWHHVAVTYVVSVGADPIFYVDGVSVALSDDNTTSGTPSPDTSTDGVVIGARATFDRFFDGRLDDVRLYSRVLSAEEVKRLYQMGR